jgi:hypothetical protein
MILTNGVIQIAGARGIGEIKNLWGCGIYCLSDVNATNPIWNKASLKIGTEAKNLWEKNSDGKYACKVAPLPPILPVNFAPGGWASIYRVGNFVFGSAKSFRMGTAGPYGGFGAFTVPAGFRPVETAFSTGFGSIYANTLVENNRLAVNIEQSISQIRIFSINTPVSATALLSFSFYYYTKDDFPV